MRVFGNLMNRIEEGIKSAMPEVGGGATILYFSDREPATVIFVSENKKHVSIQRDFAKRTDNNGMSESQTYEFSPNTSAPVEDYTLRKNGQWVREGESLRNGTVIRLGSRNKYHDFSF